MSRGTYLPKLSRKRGLFANPVVCRGLSLPAARGGIGAGRRCQPRARSLARVVGSRSCSRSSLPLTLPARTHARTQSLKGVSGDVIILEEAVRPRSPAFLVLLTVAAVADWNARSCPGRRTATRDWCALPFAACWRRWQLTQPPTPNPPRPCWCAQVAEVVVPLLRCALYLAASSGVALTRGSHSGVVDCLPNVAPSCWFAS